MVFLLLSLFSVDDSLVAAYFRHLCALGFEKKAGILIVGAMAISRIMVINLLEDNLIGMIV